MLTSIQQDALKEFLNISIGQAAHLFSQLVGHRIELSIPKVNLLSIKEEEEHYPEIFSSDTRGQILTSSIQFNQSFTGKAVLLFPMEKTQLLIHLFLGEEKREEDESMYLNEMDYDALKEIGNILLNAIMGSLGDLLGIKLIYHPPEVKRMLLTEFWKTFFQKREDYILIIYSSFHLQEHSIEGTFVVQISMQSISLFLQRIDAYVRDLDG